MTRKEILQFGKEIADKFFHKKHQEETHIIHGWVVRDRCGNCWFCKSKPHKTRYDDWSSPFVALRRQAFPQVKWSDDEPTPAELTIKLK